MLVYSPTWLFVIPGAVLSVIGALLMAMVLSEIDIFGRVWNIHTMIAGSLAFIAGVQVVSLGLCAHAYGTYFMGEKDPWFDRARARFNLEHGLALGGGLLFIGLVLCAVVFGIWVDRGFGEIFESNLALLAATMVIVGIQVTFSAFLLSILGLRRVDRFEASGAREITSS